MNIKSTKCKHYDIRLFDHTQCRKAGYPLNTILYYIKMRFGANMLAIFILTGSFILIRDVSLLKKKQLMRESLIAKVLGYLYIFGSIALFIVAKII